MIRRVPLAVYLLLLWPAVAVAAVPQTFLVQNSGWMEPFYTDPRSPFLQLVHAVVAAVAEPQETVTIASFNQAAPGNISPIAVYAGPPGPDLQSALRGIKLARKQNTAYADTDLQEAVGTTVVHTLKSKPGIIWIFTNNKNSPGNSPETAKRNREFYGVLHEEPSIVRTIAFPLAMPVAGKAYSASGLMVYGLAYGADAEARLVELAAGPLRTVLSEPPARLKPLDRDSVQFVPGAVKNAPDTQVSLAKDGRTIVLDVEVSRRQPSIELTARVENRFYPYVITRATVVAQFAGSGWADSLRVTPSTLSDLEPGVSREVSVALPIPLAQIPSLWSLASLSSMGTRISIPGAIELSLADQQLRVADTFRARLAEIFPGDPLSEVFTPSGAVRSSTVSIPVLIRIAYPLYPLILSGLGALLLVALVVGLLAFLSGEKRFELVVDGRPRRIAIKAFKTALVRSDSDDIIGTLKRGLGRPTVSQVAQGHTVTIKA